jgi:hypothetical protein
VRLSRLRVVGIIVIVSAVLVAACSKGTDQAGTDPAGSRGSAGARSASGQVSDGNPGTTTTTEAAPTPAPELVALADRASMSEAGRRAFYLADPKLVGREQLEDECPSFEEASVLGCFTDGKIFILRVDDPRLDGIEEVTAAHEMLHAVWHSEHTTIERADLGAETEAEFVRIDDAELNATIATYRDNDPEVVPDELYAILGTEVPFLSEPLEADYERWFDDRSAVVALAAQSQSVLEELEREIESLSAQLVDLDETLNNLDVQVEAQQQELADLESELGSLRAADRVGAYNALVPVFNGVVDDYNSTIAWYDTVVSDYNEVVARHNALADEHSSILRQLDPRSAPPPVEPA